MLLICKIYCFQFYIHNDIIILLFFECIISWESDAGVSNFCKLIGVVLALSCNQSRVVSEKNISNFIWEKQE